MASSRANEQEASSPLVPAPSGQALTGSRQEATLQPMLELRNRTPYRARLVAALDAQGMELAVVAIKATFIVGAGGDLKLADEQEAIVVADQHHGDPSSSSVLYESELGPGKPGTDVVLNGNAHAPRGLVESVLVELAAGPLSKAVRVVGDRIWQRAADGYRPSAPQRFASLPLVYERAYGGAEPASADSTAAFEPRNPVGVGFVTPGASHAPSSERVPNLEDPAQPINVCNGRYAPTGFGFVHRSWAPRLALAGTYDARWRSERAPLLPRDFDSNHHRAAAPGLSSPRHLRGGEAVTVTNVRPAGLPYAFRLPSVSLEVVVRVRNQDTQAPALLDTVVLEPERDRVLLVWRASVSCPRQFIAIDRVLVREQATT